jgi:anti-sigma B factor antagonist
VPDTPKFTDTVHAVAPGPVHVIELAGQLDADAAEPFDTRLKALVSNGARKFVLDFTHLKYVGSLGLRSLVGLANAVKGEGKVCVCGLGKDVRQIFEVTRVNMVLKIYATRADALDAARSA